MWRWLVVVALLAPATASGQELAAQPNGTVVAEQEIEVPGTRATQLQYRSTDAKGVPIAATATLLEPPGDGPHPLVVYGSAEDGLGAQCRPSVALPNEVAPLLERGWAVALPDVFGPRDAWSAGPLAGHVMLDAVRAVQSRLGPVPTALYGYSGGGQAAAWAAEQLPAYAPELSVLAVAAGGFTPDPEQLLRFVDGTPAAGMAFAVIEGLQRQFGELRAERFLNDAGLALRTAVAGECGEEIATGHDARRLVETFSDPTLAALFERGVQRVFEANRLGKSAPPVPVFLFHAATDERMPVAGADAIATAWCGKGASVFYARAGSGTHAEAVGSEAAVAFLADRFAGVEPVPVNCGSTPVAQIASFCPGGATTKFRLHRVRGEQVVRAVVSLDGVPLIERTGRALRRIVLRHVVPGPYRYEVTRVTEHFQRTRSGERQVVCKLRSF